MLFHSLLTTQEPVLILGSRGRNRDLDLSSDVSRVQHVPDKARAPTSALAVAPQLRTAALEVGPQHRHRCKSGDQDAPSSPCLWGPEVRSARSPPPGLGAAP